MSKDNVNHPSHYTFGDIEVIDYIRDKLTPEEFQGYCQGNVLKYVSRWRHKAGVEDLKKAQVYLGWMIESASKTDLLKRQAAATCSSSASEYAETERAWEALSQNLQPI